MIAGQTTFGVSKETIATEKKKNYGDYCTTDYLIIPQGFGDASSITFEKFCGSMLVRPGPMTNGGPVSCELRSYSRFGGEKIPGGC